MVSVEQYNLTTDPTIEKVWNQFNLNAKNGLFMFDRSYMEYHSDRFKDYSLIVKKDNKVIALVPGSLHDNEVVSHGGLTYGGFIVAKDMRSSLFIEAFDAVLGYLKQNQISAFTIKATPHIFHQSPANELEYCLFQHDATLIKRELSTCIDLSNRGKMSKGRKWIINKAKKTDIQVEESQDYAAFISLQNQVLEKHEATAVHSADEIKLLAERFPKNIKLFTAKLEGEIQACALMFIFKGVSHTQYLATSEEGKENGAIDLLIESQIQAAIEGKQRFFNFGISTTNMGRDLNAGLCQQKESFGGSALTLDSYKIDLT